MKSSSVFSKKLVRVPADTIATCIVTYQYVFSPDHGIFRSAFGTSRCRFYPSCSAYAVAAIRQYGLLRGSVASLKRIFRCNPFNHGGYDPPEHKQTQTFFHTNRYRQKKETVRVCSCGPERGRSSCLRLFV